jgi:amidase
VQSRDADALIRLTAREAVALLRTRAVSSPELTEAALARIEAVEPQVNALPIRAADRAREQAAGIDALGRGKTGDLPGFLAGLPVAIKDLTDVAGLPTTYGCPAYADNVASRSDPHVARLEQRGAVIVGKSSTPELGMLPVTDNRLFGPTRNPWCTDLTSGGSSGGAASALAAGEVWLADGSDIAGSLRIPAALTGVVGFRPSPGVVPRGQQARIFNPLAVLGPMARTVGDCALFMDALAGLHPADALSLPAPALAYQAAVDRARPPIRVAFAPDLGFGGIDPEVADVVQAAVLKLEQAGTIVEVARPDFDGVETAFLAHLLFAFASQRGPFVRENPDKVEPHLTAFVERAHRLKIDDMLDAERRRARLWADLARFFETHELLLTPTVGRAAFPVTDRGPEAAHVDGWLGADTPPAWFSPCWATAMAGVPAISIPCGFTRAGLPVGLQILGPGRGDAQVLAAAAVVEALLDLPTRHPIDPRPPATV